MAIRGMRRGFETIDLMLSFEVWQRLRDEQHLPVDQARAIILGEIERLTADYNCRRGVVELRGIEPLTSAVRLQRSPI